MHAILSGIVILVSPIAAWNALLIITSTPSGMTIEFILEYANALDAITRIPEGIVYSVNPEEATATNTSSSNAHLLTHTYL